MLEKSYHNLKETSRNDINTHTESSYTNKSLKNINEIGARLNIFETNQIRDPAPSLETTQGGADNKNKAYKNKLLLNLDIINKGMKMSMTSVDQHYNAASGNGQPLQKDATGQTSQEKIGRSQLTARDEAIDGTISPLEG